MKSSVKDKPHIIEKYLYFGLFCVSIVVSPFVSLDAFNVPKLIVLTWFGFSILLLVVYDRKNRQNSKYTFVNWIVGLMVLQLILSFFMSGHELVEGFYGASGRNTGLLTYFLFLIFFYTSIIYSNKFLLNKVSQTLIGAGLTSLIYGVVQSLNLDPFGWNNPVGNVFGFLGNPNFQSSFLAIVSSVAFTLIDLNNLMNRKNYLYLLIFLVSFYTIQKTESTQGLILFFIGTAGSIIIRLYYSIYKKVFYVGTMILFLSSILLLLDVFQKSFVPSFLYEESISYRGDFWRAGLSMAKQNLLFGVGLDGYRDQFKLYRDYNAGIRPEQDKYVDSAHNIFIDLFAGAGILFLILFFLVTILTLYSGLSSISREKSYEPTISAIFIAWICYLFQSVISISNIGLSIWGWTLSGLLIGNRYYSSRQSNKITANAGILLIKPLSTIITFAIVFPLFNADRITRSYIEEGDPIKIESAAYTWPRSVIRMNLISQSFANAGYEEQALRVSRVAIKEFPYSHEAWRQFSTLRNLTKEERALVYLKLKELDPYGDKHGS
jgi:O-antigen ligase